MDYRGPKALLDIRLQGDDLVWDFEDTWGDTVHRARGTGKVSGDGASLVGSITVGDAANMNRPLRIFLRREGPLLTGTVGGGQSNFSARYLFERER
jgi:hypothetical protein